MNCLQNENARKDFEPGNLTWPLLPVRGEGVPGRPAPIKGG